MLHKTFISAYKRCSMNRPLSHGYRLVPRSVPFVVNGLESTHPRLLMWLKLYNELPPVAAYVFGNRSSTYGQC